MDSSSSEDSNDTPLEGVTPKLATEDAAVAPTVTTTAANNEGLMKQSHANCIITNNYENSACELF